MNKIIEVLTFTSSLLLGLALTSDLYFLKEDGMSFSKTVGLFQKQVLTIFFAILSVKSYVIKDYFYIFVKHKWQRAIIIVMASGCVVKDGYYSFKPFVGIALLVIGIIMLLLSCCSKKSNKN